MPRPFVARKMILKKVGSAEIEKFFLKILNIKYHHLFKKIGVKFNEISTIS